MTSDGTVRGRDHGGRPAGLRRWLRRHWLRAAANLAGLAPLLALAWALVTGSFLFDPVKQTTVRTGRLAILFLLLSLACTPVATLTGWSGVRRARRPLGLWSLLYTALHFMTFAVWDYRLDPQLLRIGVLSQPFIIVGLGAFLFLVVLGVTSLRGLRRRMGRAWLWVQRGVYLAAVLDLWHVVWAKKSVWEVWRYLAVAGVLVLLRLPWIRDAITRARTSWSSRRAA